VVAAALAVLRIEAIRQTAAARRPLDEGLLLEAIRSADRLTVHRSRDIEVCRHLGRVEDHPDADFVAGLGVARV
jgi:hypothetical protein